MPRISTGLARLRAQPYLLSVLCLGACHSSEDSRISPVIAVQGANAQSRDNGMTVWTADASVRVQPTTAAGRGRMVVMEGPRASFESYQVIVRAGSDPLEDVNLVASDLTDGRGHTIASSNVVLFRQWFIDFAGVKAENGNAPVPASSPTKDTRLPDPLVPLVDPYTRKPLGAPFGVSGATNQPIWVDAYIPREAFPGVYRGTITVTGRGRTPTTVPISLTVWDLELPDQRAVPTFFQMDVDALIQFHRDTWACSGGSCYLQRQPQSETIIRRYEELAHSHRVDIGQVGFVPEPTAAGPCAPPTGWADFDKAVQPYMDGSYFPDNVPSTHLTVPLTPGADYGLQTCAEGEYRAIAGAWASHLKQKGWFDRAIIFAEDEPPPEVWPQVARHARWIVDADPDWKARIMGTIQAAPRQTTLLDSVMGIYVACLKCYDDWYSKDEPSFGRREWPARFRQGFELWFYESNAQVAPYPTFASNTLDGNEPRIMMWGAWYEGATGFLYWQILQWTLADAWGPNIEYGVTGDGVLVYPGHHDGLASSAGSPPEVALDGPIPSLRLKRLRNGLQDWALFRLAAEKGQRDYARTQIAQVYSQLGGCSWSGCAPMNGRFYWRSDEATMNEIRRNIAMAVRAN